MNIENKLLIGAAELPITVKIPTMLAGHINRTQIADEFIDRPMIHVIVIGLEEQSIILISLDLLELDTQDADLIRTSIATSFSIMKESVIIACTHTHTGPPSISLGLLGRDSCLIKSISRNILYCVRLASENTEPCILKSGKSSSTVGINRRLVVEGKVLMMPNPDGVRDEELIGLWFITDKGILKASIINYSMHPTTLDVGISKISGDYPEYIRQTIQRDNSECTILFFNGACGDIRPDLRHEDGGFRGGALEDLMRIGTELGEVALKTLKDGAQVLEIVCIGIESHISLQYDYSHTCKGYNNADTDPKTSRQIDPALMKKLHFRWEESIKNLSNNKKIPDSAKFGISVVAINNQVALLFLSGEIFVETGLAIKHASPFPITLICGYANGTVGYVPTAHALSLGGYEVDEAFKVYGNPAPFIAGSADQIVKESLRQLCAINDELSKVHGDCL